MNRLIAFQRVMLLWFFLWIGKEASAQSADYGDAPDPPFPTLSAGNGARHNLSPFILGTRIDGEFDGQPNPMSNGDDFMGQDDEDGVVFSTWIIAGQPCPIDVYTTGPGFLNAWIDFNSNGSWLDAGDQIFNAVLLNPGKNSLSFAVPASAVQGGYSWARFRFSTSPGLSFSGLSPDGEVEDYSLYLGVPPPIFNLIKPDPALAFCQNEISMTKVPVHNTLVAAFNDHPFPGGFGLGVAYSNNSGLIWQTKNLPYPINTISGLPMVDAFDPAVASDNTGNCYVAHIATDYNWGNGPVSGLYVCKSGDGGVTWGSAIQVSIDNTSSGSPDPAYRFNDRCQIRCDRSSASPYQNNVYLAWIKDKGWNMPKPTSDIYFSYSSNAGNSFSTAVIVNDPANDMANMPVTDIDANGDIYILWIDYNVRTGGTGILFLDKSTDGGISWSTDIIIDTLLLPPLKLNNKTDVLAKGAAVLRTHPFIPGTLYVAYAEFNDPAMIDESNIFLIRSTDGGNSWSQPVQVNDDATTNDQVLPWMELKRDGTIDLAWYDRRNNPADLLWDIYFTSSADGGNSFKTNYRITPVSFQTPVTSQGYWFGEYIGLATDDQKTYFAFTGSSVDLMGDIFFASVNNPLSGKIPNHKLHLTIHPNPAGESIQLVLSDCYLQDGFLIEIFSAYGVLLLQETITGKNQTQLDLHQLPKGIYFIRVRCGESMTIQKLIKN